MNDFENKTIDNQKNREFPLTSYQKDIWIDQKLHQGESVYVIGGYVSIKGPIDPVVFDRAINHVINLHDAHRICIYEKAGEPYQYFISHLDYNTPYYDFSNKNDPDKEALDKIHSEFVKPYENYERLFDYSLMKIADDKYYWFIKCHHLMTDGWGISLIVKAVSRVYTRLVNHEEPEDTALSYIEFINSHEEYRESDDFTRDVRYWTEKYKILPEPLLPKPGIGIYTSSLRKSIVIKRTLYDHMVEFCDKNKITSFIYFLGIIFISLARIYQKKDIIIGIPLLNRRKPKFKRIVGLFVNTAPLYMNVDDQSRLIDFLCTIRNEIRDLYRYQTLSLGQINNIVFKGNQQHRELFTVSLSNEVHDYDTRFLDYETKSLALPRAHEPNALTIYVREFTKTEDVRIDFDYQLRMFDYGFSIEHYCKYFDYLFNFCLTHPDIEPGDIDFITKEDTQQIFDVFNKTDVKYQDTLLSRLFEEHTAKHPDKVAVIDGERKLTYSELNKMANQLAVRLEEHGAGPDRIVGIMVERSIEMIVGLFAILKARGAYLPIDPAYPDERIRYMIKDSDCVCLLSKSDIIENRILGPEVIYLDDREIYRGNGRNSDRGNNPGDLAYVIYTSGSTGKPKGVMIEHNGLMNRLLWMACRYSISEQDVILQKTTFTFDVSVWELFLPFIAGAQLCLARPGGEKDPAYLYSLINDKHITMLHFVPSMLLVFLQSLPGKLEFLSLRLCICSGEALTKQHTDLFFEKIQGVELHNLYGPTEASIDVTSYPVLAHDRIIPIGKPVANTRLYILSEEKKLLPIGVWGELYISGIQVARGYINNPALTKEKFMDDPFYPGRKMYRTGDCCRWLQDGNIEFQTRMDNQVKIRGFRVELGEIESNLIKHPAVKQAVAVVKNTGNDNASLCAYIVPDKEVKTSDVKAFLKKSLPEHMIPAYIVTLDSLPLTQSGKIDRKALPDPAEHWVSERKYEAPRNEIEKKLVNAWQDILGLEKIGIKDNFFELGGDSIKAIQIVSRLQVYGLKLEGATLMEKTTIEGLSGYVRKSVQAIDQGPVIGQVDLVPIQKWYLEEVRSGRNFWNQAVLLFRKDGFDARALKEVFRKIIEHHDALRMSLSQDNTCLISKPISEITVPLHIFDVSAREKIHDFILNESISLQSKLSVHKSPLMTPGLFKAKDGDYLLMAIHHLVIDGMSWRILLEDIRTGYKQWLRGEEIVFPPKTHSFMLWSEFLKEYAHSEKLERELDYWQTVCNDTSPRDMQDRGRTLKDMLNEQLTLDRETSRSLLDKVNRAYHTDITIILLSALSRAFKLWNNEKTLLINLESHGRDGLVTDLNINRTVGWFTSLYPVQLGMPDEDIGSHIKDTKEMIRTIPGKGTGYGILRYLSTLSGYDKSLLEINPAICFNYLGQFDDTIGGDDFSLTLLELEKTRSRESELLYDLDINGMMMNGMLTVNFSYNRTVYTPDEIRELTRLYEKALKEIIEHCRNKTTVTYTPGDFNIDGLEYTDLEQVRVQTKGNASIDALYHLTPMQEGILFHYLVGKKTGAYNMQLVLEIEGTIDAEIVKKSYLRMLEDHEALRIMIVHENIKRPLQAILSERTGEFLYKDFRNPAGDDTHTAVKEFLDSDWERGFNLGSDVLIRMSLLQVADSVFVLVITNHHIILDGWCLSLLYNYLTDYYDALKTGSVDNTKRVHPYSDYIEWLKKQGKQGALRFWQTYLDGYHVKELIPVKDRYNENYYRKDYYSELPDNITGELHTLAGKLNVSINSILQSLWGVLLQKYNGTDDVVFGSVISGRPVDIEGVDRILGLFINSTPVRIKTGKNMSFRELIQKRQEEAILCEKYGYIPLVDIQHLGEDNSEVFDHLFLYENYPVDERLKKPDTLHHRDYYVKDVKVYDQTNYDFNIMIVPGNKFLLRCSYNQQKMTDTFVEKVISHYKTIISIVTAEPDMKISQASVFTQQEYSEMVRAQGYLGHYFYRNNAVGCLADIGRIAMQNPFIIDCEAVFKDNSPLLYFISSGPLTYVQLDEELKKSLPGHYFPLYYKSVAHIPRDHEGRINTAFLEKNGYLNSGELHILEKECLSFPFIDDCVILQSQKADKKTIQVSGVIQKVFYDKDIPGSKGQSVPIIQRPPAISDGEDYIYSEEYFSSLIEAFLHTTTEKTEKGIVYRDDQGNELLFRNYGELLHEAKVIASGLRKSGLNPRDMVILQIGDLYDYFPVFWGCVLCGVVPVTIAVADSYRNKNNVVNKLYNIWKLLDMPKIITSDKIVNEIKNLKQVYELDNTIDVISLHSIRTGEEINEVFHAGPGDLVFCQLSSGSTGIPKVIMETHDSIIHHILYSKDYNHYTEDDVTLNWLPVDHVVPLLTFHLKDIYLGINQIEVKTGSILADPLLWFELIQKYNVTHTWSPNFGYNLINKALAENPERKFDLSSIRYFMNAGEQVTLPVLKEFIRLTTPFGLRKHAMQPAFGMAEVCTCMTYNNDFDFDPVSVHRFLKSSLAGDLVEAGTDSPDASTFIDLGGPIKGVSIRIADAKNRVLPEGRIGRFQIRAPKLVTPGYYKNSEANKEAFVGDGWFNTGDLGFILDGRLTLTGRSKEMIIINGVNYYCYEIEDVINSLTCVIPSFAGVSSIHSEEKGTEELLVFFSPQTYDREYINNAVNEIKSELGEKTGIFPRAIIPLKKEEFLKTTSGKIQRMKMKKNFEEGLYNGLFSEMETVKEKDSLPAWFFTKKWMCRNIMETGTTVQDRNIILFGNTSSIPPEIAHIFTGCTSLVFVSPGAQYERIDALHYNIAYGHAEDYQSLFRDIGSGLQTIDTIIDLTGLRTEIKDYIEMTDLEVLSNHITALANGAAGYFHNTLSYIIFSYRAFVVNKGDPFVYENGIIQGLVKSVRLEKKNIEVKQVDIDETGLMSLANIIKGEINERIHKRDIAYRDGKRYTPVFTDAFQSDGNHSSGLFHKNDMVLVTGGLGGIGIRVCEWLLKDLQVKVLIIGRTDLDAETGAGVMAKKQKMEYLESFGKNVMYVSGDILEPGFVEESVREMEEKWSTRLGVIIHLAGCLSRPVTPGKLHWDEIEEHFMDKEQQESYTDVYMAKVSGTVVLNELRKTREKAGLIVFSSVNGHFGGASLSAYAAGNSFIEPFCEHIRSRYPKTYSFHFSMWDGVGMNDRTAGWIKDGLEKNGYSLINEDEGMSSLKYMLAHREHNCYIGLDRTAGILQSVLSINLTPVLDVFFCINEKGNEKNTRLNDTVKEFLIMKNISKCRIHFHEMDTIPRKPDRKGDFDIRLLLDSLQEDTNNTAIAENDGQTNVSEMENVLVDVWKKVLGKDGIGINDNFFQIGGDSIKAIQMVSHLKMTGYKLDVSHIVKAKTIAALSHYIEKQHTEKEKQIVTGKVDFLPIHYWFMDQKLTHMHHWNMDIMIFNESGFAGDKVMAVVKKLIIQHDALRIVLDKSNGVLFNKDINEIAVPIDVISITEEDCEKSIFEYATKIQGDMDLYNGPLLKVGLFKTSAGDHLLLALHHLIADGISLRILLEDFIAGYTQVMQGKDISILPEINSYKDWSLALHEYSRSDNIKDELHYWKNICKTGKQLIHEKDNKQKVPLKKYCVDTLTLNEENTLSLVNDANKFFNTEINAILLSALGLALNDWQGMDKVLLNLEGHGREGIIRDMDITRTIGWFTSQFPVVLEVKDSLRSTIESTKKILTSIPYKGIGYGILRYLSGISKEDRAALTITPEISFNYLGEFSISNSETGMALSGFKPGLAVSLENEQLYKLVIIGESVNSRLSFIVAHDPGYYTPAAIGNLIDFFEKRLKEIIGHCMKYKGSMNTPGKFTDQDIEESEIEEIDKLFK
ncbi:MAG: amino acid adenylation domain-containing protein [Spirochaetales bacterium]|nr:amino acid adenylation domain-containing protein [Spirochaetales bacterium]